jgi:hypothetical protein
VILSDTTVEGAGSGHRTLASTEVVATKLERIARGGIAKLAFATASSEWTGRVQRRQTHVLRKTARESHTKW